MQHRYATHQTQIKNSGLGRRRNPDVWISGPDPYKHELYYAWAKHKSQAAYRQEAYELTWEDWQKIWHKPELFWGRGRKPHDLAMTRRDPEAAWSLTNCIVVTRLEQLRMARAWALAHGR